ncbi:hypothetical protein EV379_1255 [Microterricola gilva]|uniref:Uncharacterized protein n=1 Tax=Microterricola gilva TaxID=393267 RepID=A0A4Q8AKE6_9MICO|nr:hypothetical protein [Microterricola gilva]RZU64944.1 hypothetical protein EV379_1255 [Microterricola gilva]
MSTVTGNLATFDLSSTDLAGVRIVFTPSGPAVAGTKLFLFTKPRYAYPAVDGSGLFSINLAPTRDLRPESWYSIRVEWPDPNMYGPNQGYIGVDFPDWRLYVPNEGGDFATLIGTFAKPNDIFVWWSATAPSPWPVGLTWVNTITGDVTKRTA